VPMPHISRVLQVVRVVADCLRKLETAI